MTKAIIILAAGNGTRMKSTIPKPMHKIAGKTLIFYVIKAALAAEAKEIILVSGDDSSLIQEAKAHFPHIKIAYQQKRLGTGHAARIGLELVSANVSEIQIIYGDTPLIKGETLISLSQSLSNFDLSFLGFRTLNPTNYGRFIIKNEILLDIVEEVEATVEQRLIQLCNSGIVSANKDILTKLLNLLDNNTRKQEFYLTKIATLANQSSYKVGYIITDEEELVGINSKAELAKVESIKQAELRAKFLDNGVTMIAPETVFLSDDTKIGQDTLIHPYVIFGEGVEISDKVEILSFSHIEHSIIKSQTKIGPFARLRGKNRIEENCRIGNFVEIKHSTIKTNSKASHLAYLGDSIIGQNVNIGAGTITCNYDGNNKNTTTIQDNAFIGSNSSLVAPVTIGQNSLIGAGSTITKDVPENSWAIARAKQIIIENKNEPKND